MHRVLVIEDEAVLGRNIKRTLEKDGIEVSHALSADAARGALRSETFDLVLADVTLGDGNGLDVLGEFREALDGTPVVIMTGQDSVTNRLRAEAIDAAAFLAKPFTLARLRELAMALMSHSSPQAGEARADCRVVMYSHDTIGLGHMRRNSAIAKDLVARVPGISVLMLVGCPSGMVFEPYPGIDYVKLPSLAKLSRTVWQPSSLRTDPQTTRAMREGIIERVLETMAPDILLVDHEPAGVWNELVPGLERLKARGKTRIILGLRDILDDPERVASKWAESGTDAIIGRLYDHVFVYGNREFYPSVEAYGLDQLKPGAVDYCGIVTAAGQKRARAALRSPRKVLVAGGGGRDAYPLIATALDAHSLIPRRKRPEMTVVAGPLMEKELREQLERKAKAGDVRFLTSTTDFPALLNNTDLFVSMAGYNSVNECLASGRPAIFVPRVGPSSEQRLRAARVSELGLARILFHEELDAGLLAQMIQAPVEHTVPEQAIRFDGAGVAAQLIADQLAAKAMADRDNQTKGFAHVQ